MGPPVAQGACGRSVICERICGFVLESPLDDAVADAHDARPGSELRPRNLLPDPRHISVRDIEKKKRHGPKPRICRHPTRHGATMGRRVARIHEHQARTRRPQSVLAVGPARLDDRDGVTSGQFLDLSPLGRLSGPHGQDYDVPHTRNLSTSPARCPPRTRPAALDSRKITMRNGKFGPNCRPGESVA